jgi:uncharacterized protein YjiS (DUF1127 family)
MTTTILNYRSALTRRTVSTWITRVAATVGLWRERARQRKHLAEMSSWMLADIGISTSAARAEAGKPFWMA